MYKMKKESSFIIGNAKSFHIYSGIILFLLIFLSTVPLSAADLSLSWEAPTKNADETPLTDLDGFIIYYGTESGNYSQSTDVGNTSSYTVSDLTAGSTYYFSVTAYDTSGNESVYADEVSKMAPLPDTTSPFMSAIQSVSITSVSARISWTTNEESSTQVEYGTSTSYGSTTTLDSTMALNHAQTLNNLSSNTRYHYRVRSADASGNLAISSDSTFTTLNQTVTSYYCDNDADGYFDSSVDGTCIGDNCVPGGCQITPGNDCNDSTPSINPGVNDETCNGIDENCNGTPDDEYVITLSSCGTGVCESTGQLQCQNGTEVDTCIPDSPTESTESTCDNLDNDCDGFVDEECSSTIQVSNLLLDEDFSNGIPVTWSQQGAWNTDNNCNQSINSPFDDSFAIVDSSCSATGTDELVTKTINTTSCNSINLYYNNQYYWNSGNIEVETSTDNGTTWTTNTITSIDDGYPTPNLKNIDISSISDSEAAQVKFKYSNSNMNGYWALDNVQIACQSSQLTFSSEIQTADSETMVITNTNTTNMTINQIIIEGADASSFSLGKNNSCLNQTLSPEESCTFNVFFAPENSGQMSASLSIHSTDQEMPVYNIPLSGTGQDSSSGTENPVPQLKINGTTGNINVLKGENINVTIEMSSGDYNGVNSDWWVLFKYGNRWYHYNPVLKKWKRGFTLYQQAPISNMEAVKVFDYSNLPAGQYTFYFMIDSNMNGYQDADMLYSDSSTVTIN